MSPCFRQDGVSNKLILHARLDGVVVGIQRASSGVFHARSKYRLFNLPIMVSWRPVREFRLPRASSSSSITVVNPQRLQSFATIWVNVLFLPDSNSALSCQQPSIFGLKRLFHTVT